MFQLVLKLRLGASGVTKGPRQKARTVMLLEECDFGDGSRDSRRVSVVVKSRTCYCASSHILSGRGFEIASFIWARELQQQFNALFLMENSGSMDESDGRRRIVIVGMCGRRYRTSSYVRCSKGANGFERRLRVKIWYERNYVCVVYISDERLEVVAKSCVCRRASDNAILVHEFDKKNLRDAQGTRRWVKVAMIPEEFNFGVVAIGRRSTEGNVKIWIYGSTYRYSTSFISGLLDTSGIAVQQMSEVWIG
jgi:hypothetical protein